MHPPDGYSFVDCNWKKRKAKFIGRHGWAAEIPVVLGRRARDFDDVTYLDPERFGALKFEIRQVPVFCVLRNIELIHPLIVP